jgi:hypothetical protein
VELFPGKYLNKFRERLCGISLLEGQEKIGMPAGAATDSNPRAGIYNRRGQEFKS